MKLHLDCKKALGGGGGGTAYCLSLSALGKGLEFFTQENEPPVGNQGFWVGRIKGAEMPRQPAM